MSGNEIATVEKATTPITVDITPASLISTALQNGASLEQMDKLFDLQMRYEENEVKKQEREAKKAYVTAMAAFKENAPDISKDKTVGYTNKKTGELVGYQHASLGNVTKTINTALGKHGLSAGWKTTQDNGNITVTCIVTHKDGHSESTSLTAAPDNSGKKNAIQSLGSTISYLERYTVLAITGCATCDQDDDGQASGNSTPQITAQDFRDKIDSFLDGDDRFDELQEWFGERKSYFERLTADEQASVKSYKKQVEDVMKEKSQPKPPKTFKCHSGLEVVVTDCAQCPSNEGCKELKQFKSLS